MEKICDLSAGKYPMVFAVKGIYKSLTTNFVKDNLGFKCETVALYFSVLFIKVKYKNEMPLRMYVNLILTINCICNYHCN